jgi:hypothetical protein
MKTGKKGRIIDSDSSSTKDDDFELSINLKIGDKDLRIDINDKLHIPSIDVLTPQKACNMMAENSAIHARWNVLANQAAIKADYEKMKFEVWAKEQSRHYREELAQVAGKKPSEKMIDEALMIDPEYLRRYSESLKKKEDALNIRSIAIGFAERGDRLVNIVSMMKWEKPSSSVKRRRDDDDATAFSDSDDKETNDTETDDNDDD